MTDATLPAAVPLRLPPRSAYATPSSKSSKSTQRLKSSLTYYPIRPFTPLHVCMKDLTADIFHGRLHGRLFRLLHAVERLKCRTVITRQLHFLEPHSLSSGLFAAIDTP